MAALEALTEEEAALVAILTDPSGSELAEFAYEDPQNKETGGRYRLWDFQWSYNHCEEKYQVDAMGRGLGKALDLNTPVPTPFGWTTMGALNPGDVVFDDKGKPTTVLKAFDVLYGRPCYEMEFSDGSTIVCDEQHLWTTWDKRARVAAQRGQGRLEERVATYDRVVAARAAGERWEDIARAEGFKEKSGPAAVVRRGDPRRQIIKPEVRTTRQILDTLTTGGKGERNHSIPLAGALALPERDLALDPYFLGLWLGDGDSAGPSITNAYQDSWSLDELERRGFELSPHFGSTKGKALHVGVSLGARGDLARLLSSMSLIRNKHIPAAYLRASERQRRELLAGLMDSDGHATVRPYAEITQKSQVVADGVFELLVSLGEKPVMHTKMAKIDGRDICEVRVVTWRPQANPFMLPRKAARWLPTDRQATRSGHRHIVAVRPVDSVPVRCIEVDSPGHQFLAGRTMIPTHNSVSAQLRACAFPFNFPGQEMLITAPELNHLALVTDKVEEALLKYRVLREMLPGAARNVRSNGIKKQPQFQASFVNGSKILSRLPGKTGKGVKGPHPLAIELDELQDMPRAGFVELTETIKISEEGAMWRCHGVSNGIGDIHYDLTNGKNPDMPFYVHRYIASHRPTWNDEERKAKIAMYGGSEEAPDYVRNIFGEPGSAHNPVFVLARLMASVRQNESDWATRYNEDVYTYVEINDERRAKSKCEMADLIQLPAGHLSDEYSSFWAGMDVGYTTDPSEILVFGVVPQKGKPDLHRLLTRISLIRISTPHQVDAVLAVFDHYGRRLRRYGMDKTGNGLPLFQLLKEVPTVGRRIAGYGFSEVKPVEFDDRELAKGETQEDLVIKKRVVDFATDTLRKWVDTGAMELPEDTDLLNQWRGQSIQNVRGAGESAVRKYVGGADHTLDAARMFAAAKELDAIEKLLEKPKVAGPVLDMFF